MLFPSVLPLLPPSDGQNEFSLLSPLLLDFGCPWQQRSVSSILLNVDIEHYVDDEVRMSVLTFSLAAFRHVQLIETSNLIQVLNHVSYSIYASCMNDNLDFVEITKGRPHLKVK